VNGRDLTEIKVCKRSKLALLRRHFRPIHPEGIRTLTYSMRFSIGIGSATNVQFTSGFWLLRKVAANFAADSLVGAPPANKPELPLPSVAPTAGDRHFAEVPPCGLRSTTLAGEN
jgi:hypothetical protein